MISIYYFLGIFSIILLYIGICVRAARFFILAVGVMYGYCASLSVVEHTDIAVYRSIFLQMQDGTFNSYNYDFLFWGLMDIFASVGSSFEFFYFAITTITIVTLLLTAKYFSRTPKHFLAFAALFFVSTAFFFFQQNIIRQGFAAALFAPFLFAPAATPLKMYYFRGFLIPIHFSSVFVYVIRRNYLTVLFAGALFWLALSLPLPGELWLVKKALRLLDKDYSAVIFIFSGALSFFIYKRNKDKLFLNIAICLVALSFVPYIGYRLFFFLQGPILLGLVNVFNSSQAFMFSLSFYIFGGMIFYTHPSILKLSYVLFGS